MLVLEWTKDKPFAEEKLNFAYEIISTLDKQVHTVEKEKMLLSSSGSSTVKNVW